MKLISSKPLFSVSSSSLSQFRIFISHFSTSSFPPSRRHEEESRNVRVSVWWDFENCNLPAGVNVFKVTHTITAAIRAHGIKGPITITAFGDVLQLSRTNQEALSATGINIAHVPNAGKNSADRSLLVDLMYWVSQNPPPAHLFLISGDRDFASILHRLRMKNYNILLASPDTAPNVLCSAASIMWHWNSLVRGENLTGKHFNQPPDGPYGSWYGHYKVPLEDPFSVVEQPAARSSRTDEVCHPTSDPRPGPIPRPLMKQIRKILNSYPSGISMIELRAELNKGYAGIDRDLYGYKTFSRFLLAMPHILKLLPGSDGQFFIRGITPKAPEPFESSLGTSNGHVGRNGYQDLSKPVKLNGEKSHKDEAADGKSVLPSSPEVNLEDPSGKIQQPPELSKKVVRMEMKEPLKKKPQPTPAEEKVSMPAGVQETEGNLSPVEEQDFSSEVGFFRKIWCRWFGGKDGASEIKSQNIPEKCSDSGDISEKTSHSYPEKSCINSDNFEKIKVNEKSMRSPSQDAYPVGSSEENKSARSTEPPDDNYTPRTGVLKRIINWCKFQSSSQDTDTSVDPSNKRQIEINSNSHRHEVFMKDSFWSDMESFMDSPRGSVIVTQSRTREQLAQCLRKEGPLALRDLSDSDLLNLVDMLISEKKWVEESPSEISPFKLTRPVVTRSSLGHSCAANGLRSIFLSTQSQSNLPNVPELNGEKKVQNISHAGVSPPTSNEKPLDRSRNDILADCQNLVSEILKEHPEGYNMGSFRKLFLERYGYHLDLKQLGYQKLASLILMMPGVKIESSHIFPSRQKVGGSDQEFFFDKVQEDNAYHPLTSSDSGSSETSKKNDDSDSPWDELGPISNSSFDRKDGQSMPRNSVMEEKKKRYPDYEPSVSDDEISDSEDEVSTGTLPEGRGKPVIKEEDSSLLQILNSWYSSNEGDQKKDRLENVDGMVDCSTKGVKPSSSSEISTKGETSSVIFERKQRPQRSYSFVSDPVENNKDKLIDGILGSLKKSGESRIQS